VRLDGRKKPKPVETIARICDERDEAFAFAQTSIFRLACRGFDGGDGASGTKASATPAMPVEN